MKKILYFFCIVFSVHNLYASTSLPSDEVVDNPIDGPVAQVCTRPCLIMDTVVLPDQPFVGGTTYYDETCCDLCTTCSGFAPTTSTNSTTHVVTKSQKGVYEMSREVLGNEMGIKIYCSCVTRKTYSCATGYCGNPMSDTSNVCKSIPINGKCVSGAIQCNADYYKSNNLCVACPANATCSGGTASFVCKTGYQKNAAGDACVANCTSTEYFNGVKCVACPDNASCDNETRTVMCNPGYYRTAFFSQSPTTTTYSCAECPKNATCAGGTAGFICNIGYYSSGRVIVNGGGCTACPEGGTTDTAGSTSVSACKMVDGGTYFDNTGSYTLSGGGCTYELTTAI